jgi:uncharacterized protein YlaI
VTCDHKVRYKTRTQAMLYALKRVREAGRPLRAYRCPECHRWHLTKRVASDDDDGVVK